MQLEQWRESVSMNRAQAAAYFGVSRPTVTKWETGAAFPSPPKVKLIHSRTNGKVTAKDWYRLRDRKLDAAAAADE